MLKEPVRELMEETLRVSDLPDPPLPIEPHHVAILGFLRDSRRMLPALLVLAEADMDDMGDGLARTMFEQATTAGWLLADPAVNFERFRQAYESDWSGIREAWAERRPEEPFPHLDAPATSAVERVRLPSIRKRAKATGLDAFLVSYKLLCLSVHGTMASASFGLNREPRRGIRYARIGLGAAMVLELAEKIDLQFGMGKVADIHRAKWRLFQLPGLLVAPAG